MYHPCLLENKNRARYFEIDSPFQTTTEKRNIGVLLIHIC
jgi:hypothetical protein